MMTALLKEIAENGAVERIAKKLPRVPTQVNARHQSDAEILDVGLEGHYLAATTDSIAEEIQTGLYSDPWLMGWMAVVVNLSDLAATGATPLGMLLAFTISPDWDDVFVGKITEGAGAALTAHGCGSLGGDLNTGSPVLGGTAIGIVEKKRLKQRIGITDGDYVYATGPAGMGGAYALLQLSGEGTASSDIVYKPEAKLAAANIIAPYATACMDTSDGFIATLDQLFRLNRATICLEDLPGIVHPSVATLAETSGIPLLCFLAAIHGEFELCFTVAESRNEDFMSHVASFGFHPVRVGRVKANADASQAGLFIKNCRLPSGDIRNLWSRTESMKEYLTALSILAETFSKRVAAGEACL